MSDPREIMARAEAERALAAARASADPRPAPGPQPGDNQHASESPEMFLARVAREMTS